MARRVVTRGRMVHGVRRQNLWLGFNIGSTTLVGSSAQLISSLNAAALALRPFTVVRTRLLVTFESDQAAVSERPIGSFGVQVVTDNATAIGITAVPQPDTDTDNDFFVYQSLIHSTIFLSSIGLQTPAQTQFVIDSKAMRKVGPGDDIAMTTELSTASGAVLVVQGRALLKLH